MPHQQRSLHLRLPPQSVPSPRPPPSPAILPAEVAPPFSCSRCIRSPVSILIHPIRSRSRPRPRISSPRPPLAPIPILRAEVAPGVLLLPPHRRSPAKLKPLLSRANLLIARDIEWANIMLAFEQESRYIIM
ncbi:hypothetical protein DKP78_15230, partial [Enterococcus faecium]